MKSVRKIPKTSRVFSLQGFYSFKNNSKQFCESYNESMALLTLEFDNSVVSYTTQPPPLLYLVGEKRFRYTADVLVKYVGDKFESIEIKEERELLKSKNITKFDLLKRLYPIQMGHPLKILKDVEIFKGKKINNLKNLYRYRQEPITDVELSVYAILPQRLTFESLVAAFSHVKSGAYHSAMLLLSHDYFDWDVESLLSGNTLLEKAGKHNE